MKKIALSLVVVLAMMLAVAVSTTAMARTTGAVDDDGAAIAGGTTPKAPCIPGDANEDGFINMGDVTYVELIILGYVDPTCGADANEDGFINMGDATTIQLIVLGYYVNLTVVSDGCCPIDVGAPVSQTVAAGGNQTFYNIFSGTNVSVSADDSDPCCDFDSWSDGGAQTHDILMDADKSVTATCNEPVGPPVPQPCCWCIWLAEWWEGTGTPTGDPDNVEYFALHTVELLPAGHTETLPGAVGQHVISDPSWHQEAKFYGGPEPNGYAEAEWEELLIDEGTGDKPGVDRFNSILGKVYATGLGYWNSQLNMLNWKSRYDVNSGIGPLVVWAVTLNSIAMSGNAGWPYAVGNSWLTVGISTITAPSTSYHECSGTETITTPLFPGGIECFRVESYTWADADGVDDDWDGQKDEDPWNGYDDDGDFFVDEDGGDGVPQPGELTLSATNWYHNCYGCPIKKETYPGALYDGYETLYIKWYCFDPPLPPWLP